MSINQSNQIKFLFISSSDLYGGASIAGYSLHKELVNNGHISTMVVNSKFSDDNTVIELNGRIKQFKNDVHYAGESSSLNPIMSIVPYLV